MLPPDEPRLLMSEALEKIIKLETDESSSESLQIFVDGSRVCDGGRLKSFQVAKHEMIVTGFFSVTDIDLLALRNVTDSEALVSVFLKNQNFSTRSLLSFSCTVSKKDRSKFKCTFVFNI